ncbi:MAG TPA: hypothetical protein DEQ38_03420 [Elusimicrobia bacterium]|nr:MAG: hypothetical protein A2089_04765 [Elusimicrobia bacterium GWD2_63_28]HBB67656.1 hypothetical protein [Elusimicrobiota bacterium]HCC47153.1 hypothetical protein [Elusimicrobiota bacterium]
MSVGTIIAGLLSMVAVFPVYAAQAPELDGAYGLKKIENASEYFDVGGYKPLPDGGFYIASVDAITRIKADGSAMWSFPYASGLFHDTGLAVDSGNNAYVAVTDMMRGAAMVLKYNSAGNVVKSYTAPYSSAVSPAALGVAGNADGSNIYVAVEYFDAARGAFQVAIQRLDTELNLLKTVTVPSTGGPPMPGGNSCLFAEMRVDAEGNLYFVHAKMVPSGPAYMKYDGGLNLLWSRPPDNRIGFLPFSFTAIPAGGVYLSWFDASQQTIAIGVRRVSGDGLTEWERYIPGEVFAFNGVADGAGDFYFMGLGTSGSGYWLGKVSGLDGSLVWNKGINNMDILPFYVDDQGRIYVVSDGMSGVPDSGPFLARYVQGGGTQKKYFLSPVGETVSRIVNVGDWSTQLNSLVTGNSEPAYKIGVDFAISAYPQGATGQVLSKQSETTDANGLAGVQLKLGNLPAEYKVTATCPSCEVTASSVTFTCCGKLPNDDFKQSSSTWASQHYDNICTTVPANSNSYRPVYSCEAAIFNNPQYQKYKFTIRAKGCGLSALATLINYYRDAYNLPISSATPLSLNKYLGDNAGYVGKGSVKFDSVSDFSGQNIGYLGYKTDGEYGVTRATLIKDIDQDILASRPVIIRVSGHFMLVTGKCGSRYVVSDSGASVSGNILYDPNGTKPLLGIRQFQLN